MGKKAPSRAKPAKLQSKPKATGKPAAKAPAKPSKTSAKPTPKPAATSKPAALKVKAGSAKTEPPKGTTAKAATAKSPATGPKPAAPKGAAGKPAAAKAPAKPAAVSSSAKGKPANAKAGPASKGSSKAADKTPDKSTDKAAEAVTLGPDGKPVRKGITIVQNKPRRTGPKPVKIQIPKSEPLLGPGSPFRKPLIASGPSAIRKSLEIDPEALAKLKSPFNKKELARFRDILLKKRADLVGDVSDLESEALLGRSGSLSALPQHIAEQGSETYEQSLSLNLAAEDRRLIREIDGALQRIDKGTFGICEMTGKAITRERLEELPWTRYSIEAAREFERRSMGR